MKRGTGEAALIIVNGTIDRMTKTAVFFRCPLGSCVEMAKEKWHIGYYIIMSRGRDLECLNNGFVSARRVSRHAGMDISNSDIHITRAKFLGESPFHNTDKDSSTRVAEPLRLKKCIELDQVWLLARMLSQKWSKLLSLRLLRRIMAL